MGEALDYFRRLVQVAVTVMCFPFLASSQSADITSGLVGHWKLDQLSSTNTIVNSVNAANTQTSGVTFEASGRWGGGVRFGNRSASDPNKAVVLQPSFNAAAWSFSVWVKPDLGIPSTAPYYSQYALLSADGGGTMLAIKPDGVFLGSSTRLATFNFGGSPGWHHIVVVFDGTTYTTTVDKTAAKDFVKSSNNPYAASTGALRLGSPAWGNHTFRGVMDEVRLYNRALNGREIATLFDTSAVLSSVPPVITKQQPGSVLPSWVVDTNVKIEGDRDVWCRASTRAGATFQTMELVPHNRIRKTSWFNMRNLKHGQSYTYYIRCDDRATGLLSAELPVSFRIEADTQGPGIRELTTSNVREDSAEIVWTTGEPADSSVSLSGGSFVSADRNPDPALSYSHAHLFTGLTPGTTYTYSVASRDESGNRSVSAVMSFKTRSASPRNIYVSPNGNDLNSGEFSAPLKTLEAARNKIRSFTDRSLGATVFLRGGTYYLSAPFVLGPEDSGTASAPIVYRSYPGETVRISGGRKVTNFVPDPARPGGFYADLKALSPPITDYGTMARSGIGIGGTPDGGGGGVAAFLTMTCGTSKNEPCRALRFFFGDNPMTLARWPNKAAANWGFQNVVGGSVTGSGTTKMTSINVADTTPLSWNSADLSQAWVYGFWLTAYIDSFEKLVSVSSIPGGAQITMQPGPRDGFQQGGEFGRSAFFVENFLSALDTNEEWFLDTASGRLYFRPPLGASITGSEASVSMVPAVIKFQGTSHVKVVGVTLEHARHAAVQMSESSSYCSIENSVLRNSAVGVEMLGTQNGIWNTEIYNIDDDGVVIASGGQLPLSRSITDTNARKSLASGFNFVVNSKISKYGLRNRFYRPGVNLNGGYVNNDLTGGAGNRVRHSEFVDAPHSSIHYKGNNFLFDYNRFLGTNSECIDCGTIYTWWSWVQRGTMTKYNYFQGLQPINPMGITAKLHSVGLYWDAMIDGQSAYGNVFKGYDVPFLMNAGRDGSVENNIFFDSTSKTQEPLYIGSLGLNPSQTSQVNVPISMIEGVPGTSTSPPYLIVTTARPLNMTKGTVIGRISGLSSLVGLTNDPCPTGTTELYYEPGSSTPSPWKVKVVGLSLKGPYTGGGFYRAFDRYYWPFYAITSRLSLGLPDPSCGGADPMTAVHPYLEMYPRLRQRIWDIEDGQPRNIRISKNIVARNAIQQLTAPGSAAPWISPTNNLVTKSGDPLPFNESTFAVTSAQAPGGWDQIPFDLIGRVKAGTPPIVTATPTATATATATRTATAIPTRTATATATATRTATAIPTRTATATATATQTATATPTSTATQTATALASVTASASPTPTSAGSPTPTPTVVGSPTSSSSELPTDTIAGDHPALANTLVFLIQERKIQSADSKGFFAISKLASNRSSRLLQFRSIKLVGGGFDKTVMPGQYLSKIPEARLQAYNPAKCQEEAKQKPLFNGARRVAALERELLRKTTLIQSARHSGARAKLASKSSALRVSQAAEEYFRASALMPDIQLRCVPKTAACGEVSLALPLRVLRQAVKTLAAEGINLERALHERSVAPNPALLSKAIQRASAKSGQISRILAKLPRVTFDCTLNGYSIITPAVVSRERR
jgi:hypothetical protein